MGVLAGTVVPAVTVPLGVNALKKMPLDSGVTVIGTLAEALKPLV